MLQMQDNLCLFRHHHVHGECVCHRQRCPVLAATSYFRQDFSKALEPCLLSSVNGGCQVSGKWSWPEKAQAFVQLVTLLQIDTS